ncbi:MAG: EAL domain-containing protein [Actinomycetota bacterium]|nr:EAL domain-containing protein [Actinomycetota bacterium]
MLTDDAWTGPQAACQDEPSLDLDDRTLVVLDDQLSVEVEGKHEALLRGVIETSSAALVGCDASELIVAWSAGAERLFGYRPGDVLGRPWTLLISETERITGLEALGADVLAGERTGRLETTGVHRDHSQMPVSVEGAPVPTAGGVIGISWTFRDLAGRHRVEHVAQIGTFVLDFDESGAIAGLEVSAGVAPMLGMARDQLLKRRFDGLTELMEPDDLPAAKAEWDRVMAGGDSYDIELRLRRPKTGEVRWFRISADVYRRGDGQPWRGLGAIRDVSAERRSEEQLAYESSHDSLTRLPTTALLLRRLTAMLDGGGAATVLSIDIDHFGVINEHYGTLAGDQLLSNVADRLRVAFATTCAELSGPHRLECVSDPICADGVQASTPDASPVARTGGDSFVVVCPGAIDRRTAGRLATRVQSLFDTPFELDDQELWLTVCVGSASSDPANDADKVVTRAERALHHAKRRGPAWSLAFEGLTSPGSPALPAQVGAFRRALHEERIVLAYQPLLDLTTGRMVGVEALARWPRTSGAPGQPGDTSGPMVADPSEFIPLAEDTGLVIALDEHVLGMAARQFASWQRDLGPLPAEFTVAVNVSARHLVGDGLLATVTDVVTAAGISPESLVLEVTETALMEDITLAAATITDLRRAGVGVAIDDFGTGYSSLAYLETLSVDVLKLDRSFVARLAGARDRAIVDAVLGLAGALNFRVVAEGIETAEQADLLASLGCCYGQGYHLGRPSPPEIIAKILREEAGTSAILAR